MGGTVDFSGTKATSWEMTLPIKWLANDGWGTPARSPYSIRLAPGLHRGSVPPEERHEPMTNTDEVRYLSEPLDWIMSPRWGLN
jgi:hypothetical protein